MQDQNRLRNKGRIGQENSVRNLDGYLSELLGPVEAYFTNPGWGIKSFLMFSSSLIPSKATRGGGGSGAYARHYRARGWQPGYKIM